MYINICEFNSLNYALKLKNKIGQDKKFLTLNLC